MGFSFLHTSDLHLGKAFGTMPDDVRGRLIEARHQIIETLAAVARRHSVRHILVAGDTFDTTSPSPATRRQAAIAMSADKDLQWWIIPGNHDSLAGEELWAAFEAEVGDNVHLIRDCEPIEIEPRVWLLPAPLDRQFVGRDLTAWMDDAQTPDGQLRIGLAHGAVTTFSEDQDGSGMIAPDRAARARLDYLALGDWHGVTPVDVRTAYCGTPERESFRHQGAGSCNLVTLGAAGAIPTIETVATGRFDWTRLEFDLTPAADVTSALAGALPTDVAARRDVLMRIDARGFLTMEQRAALEDAAQIAAPDFAFFRFKDDQLATEYHADDLDLIATSGALRVAAEALQAEAKAEGALDEQARVAQAALNRLWSMVREA